MRKGSRIYRLFEARFLPQLTLLGLPRTLKAKGDGAPPTSSARRSLATWLAPTYLAYYYRNLRPTPTGCELSWDTRCQEKDDPPWSVPTVWHPMADHVGWRKHGAPYHPEWAMSKGGVSKCNDGSPCLHGKNSRQGHLRSSRKSDLGHGMLFAILPFAPSDPTARTRLQRDMACSWCRFHVKGTLAKLSKTPRTQTAYILDAPWKKKAAHLTLILDPRRCLLVQVDLIHRPDILSDLPAPCCPASLPRLCNFAIRRSSFPSLTQPQRILVLTFSS